MSVVKRFSCMHSEAKIRPPVSSDNSFEEVLSDASTARCVASDSEMTPSNVLTFLPTLRVSSDIKTA